MYALSLKYFGATIMCENVYGNICIEMSRYRVIVIPTSDFNQLLCIQ